MFIKRLLISGLLCLILFELIAQTVNPNRLTNWDKAGVETLIPSYDSLVLVTSFGAKGDGTTNDSAAFANAIAHFGGRKGCVLIPAGTFRIEGTINLTDSVLLRGEGSGISKLQFYFSNQSNDCIRIRRTSTNTWSRIDSSSGKGGRVIRLSSTLSITKGDWIEIRNRRPGQAALSGRPDTAFGQINRVDSVSGLRIWLRDALRFTPDSGLLPEARRLNPIRAAGIECITIERMNANSSGAGKNILLEGAVNCWVRGVQSNKSLGAHILVSYGAHNTISGCYFNDAWFHDGGGTRGYGVLLFRRTTLCLVENNIFRRLRHSMQLQEGSNANVFAYNYSRETYKTDFGFPFTQTSDLNFHGTYPYCNLFEGNIGHYLHFDNANGPNGPWNLAFRNQVNVNGMAITNATYISDSQSLVANDANSQSIFGSGHYRHGNRINGSTHPSGTDSLWINSYYLNQKPWFWRDTSTWPAIGRPNSYGNGFNTAKKRWDDNNKLALCEYQVEWSGYTTNPDDDLNFGQPAVPREFWLVNIPEFPPGGNMPEMTKDLTFYRLTLNKGASFKTGANVLRIRENVNSSGNFQIEAGGELLIGR